MIHGIQGEAETEICHDDFSATAKNENSSAGLGTEILPLHSVRCQNDIEPFDRLRANGKRLFSKG
jgi:hypothetical protein